MFANATMSSSAKWLIDTLGSFAHKSVTIIHFVSRQVLLEGLSSLTAGVDPTVWVPFGMILPYFPVDLSERGGSDSRVTFGNDILTVL
jgi:hypothetical protein